MCLTSAAPKRLSWLSVVPSPALGPHLRRAESIPFVKYRLGVPVYSSAGLFETAASADLGPSREEKHLLPGTIARPGDVTIQRWVNGKDVAIDVTVTGPLCPSNVADAAREPRASLSKAYQRKTRETAGACRLQGLVVLPLAMETLGGLHSGAVGQVKQLAACLARCKGLEEGDVTDQLFGKLSLTLMRGNALMITSRCQGAEFPPTEIDGVE